MNMRSGILHPLSHHITPHGITLSASISTNSRFTNFLTAFPFPWQWQGLGVARHTNTRLSIATHHHTSPQFTLHEFIGRNPLRRTRGEGTEGDDRVGAHAALIFDFSLIGLLAMADVIDEMEQKGGGEGRKEKGRGGEMREE